MSHFNQYPSPNVERPQELSELLQVYLHACDTAIAKGSAVWKYEDPRTTDEASLYFQGKQIAHISRIHGDEEAHVNDDAPINQPLYRALILYRDTSGGIQLHHYPATFSEYTIKAELEMQLLPHSNEIPFSEQRAIDYSLPAA